MTKQIRASRFRAMILLLAQETQRMTPDPLSELAHTHEQTTVCLHGSAHQGIIMHTLLYICLYTCRLLKDSLLTIQHYDDWKDRRRTMDQAFVRR